MESGICLRPERFICAVFWTKSVRKWYWWKVPTTWRICLSICRIQKQSRRSQYWHIPKKRRCAPFSIPLRNIRRSIRLYCGAGKTGQSVALLIYRRKPFWRCLLWRKRHREKRSVFWYTAPLTKGRGKTDMKPSGSVPWSRQALQRGIIRARICLGRACVS